MQSLEVLVFQIKILNCSKNEAFKAFVSIPLSMNSLVKLKVQAVNTKFEQRLISICSI